MTDAVPHAGRRKAALVFIFITVVLDMIALGMILPVLPSLIESFVGGDTARASTIYGAFGSVFALMQFIFSPLLGLMSDRFGRRRVILISSLGLGLDYILMAWAPSLEWLFVGRVISGVTAASITAAQAYVADVTPPEKRAGGFGLIGAAFGVGFILGPAIGGLLADYGPRIPFWVAAGFSLANTLYGLFILPESLAPENRPAWDWRKANPVGSLKLLRATRGLMGLTSVNFLRFLAHTALPSVFVLYGTYRYDWSQKTVGLTLAGVGVCSAVVEGGLTQRIVTLLGTRYTLLFGMFCGVAGFAIFGLAPTGFVFWFGLPFLALWGLSRPATQELMSLRVSPSQQGQLQGAQSSLMGITGMVGPALFSFVFSSAIGVLAGWNLVGAPFLLAAAMLLIALIVAWFVTRPESVEALVGEQHR